MGDTMVERKPVEMDIRSAPTDDDDFLNRVVDWSPEEEKKAKRKLDSLIMPILTLGFFCLRKSANIYFLLD
jgi:hypothetical protein